MFYKNYWHIIDIFSSNFRKYLQVEVINLLVSLHFLAMVNKTSPIDLSILQRIRMFANPKFVFCRILSKTKPRGISRGASPF